MARQIIWNVFYRANDIKDLSIYSKARRSKNKKKVMTSSFLLNEKLVNGKNYKFDFNLKIIKSFMFSLNKREIISKWDEIFDHLLITQGHDLILNIHKLIYKKFNRDIKIPKRTNTEYCTFL